MTKYDDKIYGTINLPSYIGEIVDTPEFQRLKSIKQLGAKHHVFKNATHTRFDHSIG